MINRELKNVVVVSYTNTVDSYGQKKQTVASSTTVSMAVKPYRNTATDDIRFRDVELIGLTKATIDDKNTVTIDNVQYAVLYVINAYSNIGYNQVFLKKQ